MIRLVLMIALVVATPLFAQTPTINASPSSVSLGTTVVGATGTAASFDVNGSNLLADLTITPPTGVEIRTGAGAFQNTALSLAQTGGTVAATTIDVRTSAAATTGQAFSDITCVAGAASQNVTLTGAVVAQPVITVGGGPLAYGSVYVGNSSQERSFSVAGVDLLADITVTAPTHVELSAVTGGPYTPSIVLAHSGGVVANTTLFARVKNTAPGGMINSSITAASTSAVDQNVGVTAAVRYAGFAGGGEGGGDDGACSTSFDQGLGMVLVLVAILASGFRLRRRETR
jgi:hypothetical protein